MGKDELHTDHGTRWEGSKAGEGVATRAAEIVKVAVVADVAAPVATEIRVMTASTKAAAADGVALATSSPAATRTLTVAVTTPLAT